MVRGYSTEKDEAYNLYHEVKRFKKKAKERGFVFIRDQTSGHYTIERKVTPTSSNPSNRVGVGEIFDNRYLVIYIHHVGRGDSRRDRAVSGLQKLVKSFVIS